MWALIVWNERWGKAKLVRGDSAHRPRVLRIEEQSVILPVLCCSFCRAGQIGSALCHREESGN